MIAECTQCFVVWRFRFIATRRSLMVSRTFWSYHVMLAIGCATHYRTPWYELRDSSRLFSFHPDVRPDGHSLRLMKLEEMMRLIAHHSVGMWFFAVIQVITAVVISDCTCVLMCSIVVSHIQAFDEVWAHDGIHDFPWSRIRLNAAEGQRLCNCSC